jgi:hypothetical protein
MDLRNVNLSAILGVLLLAIGTGAQFGWPFGLITAGASVLAAELLATRSQT